LTEAKLQMYLINECFEIVVWIMRS
jgi:hypothetical protein